MTGRKVGSSGIERGLIMAAAVMIILFFVKFASNLITPILLAAFLASIATPPLRWMRAKGVPKYLALGLIVFILFDIGSLIAIFATGALETLQDRIPTYQERIGILANELAHWLQNLGVEDAIEFTPSALDARYLGQFLRTTLASVGDILASGFLILLAVVFMLLEAPTLSIKVQEAFGLKTIGKERLRSFFKSINKYFLLKGLMSFATAMLIFILLTALDVDFSVLLSLIAFFANFIPFVGAVIMTIPGVALALLQTDPTTAGLVALGYVFANILIGSILEPRIMGRGLGMSTLAVFLSLLFWGWLLGIVGVFLSVPLTMALIFACEASPRTRPIAILLRPAAKPDTSEAGEPNENGK